MQLEYIDIPALIAASGDPWAVNQTLQVGRPAQISSLAAAFHGAGRSTTEADATFDQARGRFEAAWTHENGDSPINAAAEVQRTAHALGAQSEQLPKIGAHLEEVAAALAEAQKGGKAVIAGLETSLQGLDDMIRQAVQMKNEGKITADELRAFTDTCEEDAVRLTKRALGQLHSIRNGYSRILQKGQSNLATDGYDPARVWGVDGHEAETPESAERDVRAALGGDRAAASRVNGVLGSITPDQVAGTVPLTAEQASVLSQLQAQQHGMSIDALKTAEQRLGDDRRMIGDSWQLMSNPSLVFPKTPLKVGAQQGSDTVRGGVEQLPDSVQQTLDVGQPGWMYADQTRTVADIVRDGDPALQRNTGIDQGLLHKGAMIMTQDWSRNTFDGTVESVFWAAGRDHQAVNWIVNQQGVGDQSTQDFLKNITHHAWSDGGEAAGSLFGWTQDAAGPEARIAGQTAQTYAAYLGSHSHELLDLPGHHTLGQVDPKLTQAFARGLSPYVTNIAGGTNELSQYFHTPDTNADVEAKLPIAKGIFSVLSTDKDASNIFNGAAMQQIMADQNRYADAVAHHVPGAVANDADLQQAATLKGLVDVGVNNAVHAEGLNGAQQAHEAYSRKESAYNSVVKGGSTALGLAGKALPPPYNMIGKIGGPALTMGGNALQQDIIGAPPSATAPHDVVIPHMQDSTAYSQVLDGLVANRVPTGLPPQFFAPDVPGDPRSPLHIATYDEYVTNCTRVSGLPPLNDYQFNQTLKNAVQGILGDGTVIPHMQHQYDAVTQIPDP
ncbi:hypothetical protein A5672_10730 [Mycobacterium alsense]|uniref:ESX-1 secretion-associated protein EspA/EspE-like domain-containing protein n=1 Tax=Mycobacterium alsense TaxID=324058 RepID=A0ABD6P428_9MYCO|nr:hypothetical protein [Mycobacterium alsense]OBG43073.1 hypothetical protein A5672_10730 [Mycobacterium alsense]